MARTIRTRYDGTPMRDGDHGHRCPEAHCDWCVRKPPPEKHHEIREQRDGT